MAAGRLSVTDLSVSEYISLITSKTVTLIVGPKRKSYPVHKDLLCRLSEYFHKAFHGSLQEAQKEELYLKEENPAAIEFFIGWVYRGADALAATEKCLAPLLELYLTADKWCLPVVQNAVVDSTRAWFKGHPEKGLKALVVLAKGYYDLLDKKPRDQYGDLMKYYAVQLCLTGEGKYADFLRVTASNAAFAQAVANVQMSIMRAHSRDSGSMLEGLEGLEGLGGLFHSRT
ncbi:hypothetical protein MMC18_003118 [Xylographa bjoerkii]|nr:hypothetical protein [Xylographa bjoerkii]